MLPVRGGGFTPGVVVEKVGGDILFVVSGTDTHHKVVKLSKRGRLWTATFVTPKGTKTRKLKPK